MPRIRRTAATAARAGGLAAWAAAPAAVASVTAGQPVREQSLPRPALTRMALAAPGAGSAPAAKPATTTGSVFRMAVTRHYGTATNASGYSVIVATGSHQAWVFGGTNPGGPSAPVAALWDGATATTATLPAGLSSFISDASATSGSDVWAASQYGRYVLHYDGTRWRIAKRWQSGQVTGLTAVTPSDVWVFGTVADGTSKIGTWHYDGTSWQRMTGLGGSVCRASAVSANDIWAIAASPAAYSVLHFDGSDWQPVPTGTALNGIQPRDILANSARDVWIVGTKTAAAGGVRLVLLHWDGVRWAVLVTGINAWPGRLAPGPGHTVLVTATPTSASASALILQASAADGRPVVSSTSSLGSGGISDVVLPGRSGAMWASGAVLTRLGGDAVVWAGQRPPAHDRFDT